MTTNAEALDALIHSAHPDVSEEAQPESLEISKEQMRLQDLKGDEDEKEPEPDKAKGERTSEQSARDEAEEALPWDLDRQRRDQENANLHKTVAQLVKQQDELIAELRSQGRSDAGMGLEEASAELEKLLENEPDEFDSDEDKQSYVKKAAKLSARIVKLTKQAAKDEKKPEDKAGKAKEPERDIQADYRAILDACDAKYGADIRRSANREIQKVFRQRWPTGGAEKQAMEDIAMRVYAELRQAADTKAKAKADEKPKPKAKAEPDRPSGKTGPAPDTRSRVPSMADYAAAMKRERAAGRG